ncbi:mediator complex subunit, partial [Tulasnella sp. 403]
ARYLGLHATKNINVPPAELIKKFGRIYTSLYIRLAPFPTYYLVALITDEEIKWALVNVKDVVTGNYPMLAIDDFGWLEAPRIGGASERERRWSALAERSVGPLGAEDAQAAPPRHHLSIEPEILRELYAFCCARVSHTKIEQQLKTRKIPYSSVFTNAAEGEAAEHEAVNASSLTPFCATAQSVPKICIRIGDLVRSEAVTNVAYENVKIKVVDWWSERPCRVITSVRLRDIQPVSDLSLGSGSGRGQILDASRNITYDPVTSIVSFISYDVNTCVEEFLGEWERVQRAAGIVREVGHTRRKRRWSDIQILSFNLQRVELVYHSIYAVAIQWIHPSLSAMATNGLYEMDFKVIGAPDNADGNPHQDIAGFLCRQLQSDATRSMSTAVEGLILVLRDSLPILLALQKVKRDRPGRVNLFVKSASRYRLLYGLKHAVDFRILPHSQVIVSDAATLIAARPAAERATAIFERIPSFDDMCGAILRQVGPPPLGSSMPPVLQ